MHKRRHNTISLMNIAQSKLAYRSQPVPHAMSNRTHFRPRECNPSLYAAVRHIGIDHEGHVVVNDGILNGLQNTLNASQCR